MLQKEIGWGFTGEAGYVATRSVRQLGFIDINAGQIPFTNRTTQPLLQQWGRTAATTFLEPLGTGHYDSLQASLRSEEHTSELQSRLHLVCRLLLEKKKAS